MKKILVLGANSFSGQDFVDLLLDDPNNEVIGVLNGVTRFVDRNHALVEFLSRPDSYNHRFEFGSDRLRQVENGRARNLIDP